MILTLEKDRVIRSDLVKSTILRSDLSPVPATLEAEIRADYELRTHIKEGVTVSANGTVFRIIKAVLESGLESQGSRDTSMIKIIALLDACHKIAFVRGLGKAVIKENANMIDIYRSSGASLNAIDNDFQIPRFCCLSGQAPSYHIARAMQEEGGVVSWKRGKMRFFRLPDLFKQEPRLTLPDNADENIQSEFLARHDVPGFFSVTPTGAFVHGNNEKERTIQYMPFMNEQRLRNMTRCLVLRKIAKIGIAQEIYAGDLIDISGGQPLVVITAAHAFESGIDGEAPSEYTRLWLGGMEE